MKPRWVLRSGVWWLDAIVDDVNKPALHVTELISGVFEIHLVRQSAGYFVIWKNGSYESSGITSTRLVADEIWYYVTTNFDIVAGVSFQYNGIENFRSTWPNRGQLGID